MPLSMKIIIIIDKYFKKLNSSLHMSVKQHVVDEKVRLEFKYRIQSGPSPVQNYGLALARSLRFPSSMLDRADELILKVEDDSVLPFMDEVDKQKKEDKRERDGDVTMMDETTHEIDSLEKDVIDLYSYVLLLMSTEGNQNLNYISIEIINDKLRDLISSMTPSLQEMLKKSSLEDIISVLNNSTKSSNETFNSSL